LKYWEQNIKKTTLTQRKKSGFPSKKKNSKIKNI
jgi:hypothetical protein